MFASIDCGRGDLNEIPELVRALNIASTEQADNTPSIVAGLRFSEGTPRL